MKRLALLLLSLLVGVAPSAAIGAIFIMPGTESWWLSKNVVRIMGKQVDAVPLAAINSYLQQNAAADELCFVEGLETAQIIGLHRQTQQHIDATFKREGTSVFRLTAAIPDGRTVVVRSGIYEECDGTTGGLVLVYELGTSDIALASVTEDQPFNFLFKADRPALAGSGSCFECGDWNSLYYDVTRKKFYWEYEGD